MKREEQVPASRRGRGAPRKDIGITPDELRRRYQGGENIRALAASLGCSFGTLQRRLHETGIEVRPRGGSEKGRRWRRNRVESANEGDSAGEGLSMTAVINNGPHKGRRIPFPRELDEVPQELSLNQETYVLGNHVPDDGFWYYRRPSSADGGVSRH
ncbi:helix-turn-helix domain-containing protein [Streptomyces phytophilus]|uniref:helix-turn-helix domain-containing protein n=1 Tax=Streptomyces phytophilus TaxID=722715 RepID=UPI001C68BD79